MAFKMKGDPMKRNFGVGGPAKLKKETKEDVSPMKSMGDFEMNPATGKYVRVSSDFADRDDLPFGTSQLKTGEEAVQQQRELRADFGEPLDRRGVADMRKRQQENLARYGGLSKKEASLANALDQSIQQKYNEGRAAGKSIQQIKNSLTPQEREFEQNTLDFLNQEGGFLNK